MQSKAGLFIGEALLANPSYPIQRLKFKDVDLEENGLYRLLEAVNINKNITKLHVGIVSDYGLRTMSELLTTNTSLLKLEFQESKYNKGLYIFLDLAKPWTENAKQSFCSMLKSYTELQKVQFDSKLEGEELHEAFKSEIEFYTDKKLKAHKAEEKFQKRH